LAPLASDDGGLDVFELARRAGARRAAAEAARSVESYKGEDFGYLSGKPAELRVPRCTKALFSRLKGRGRTPA